MALGNVNDAPVRLNALVIENVRLSLPVLQERLTLHYSNEFFGQLYRVLGSADFLGWVKRPAVLSVRLAEADSMAIYAETPSACSPTFPVELPTSSFSPTTVS